AADPHNVMAHASMGAAYEITGNYKKALAQFDQVVALQPKTDGSYGLRADVRAHLKDYAGALADYSQATLLDPADPGNWRDLAWLLATCPNAKVRDGKRAVEAARKACELSRWQDADDVDALAAALAESGDFAGAVKFEQWYLTLPGVKDGDALSAKSRLAGYQVGKPWRD
ncbi:MAG TPA: hypothetical protein VG733_08355, partial [Chthoniobacteraceae bacterium]|nr:hypothetical protein [Chthoniobacteraceae bacterium]